MDILMVEITNSVAVIIPVSSQIVGEAELIANAGLLVSKVGHENGDSLATINYAQELFSGDIFAKDEAKGREILLKCAETGFCTEAKFLVGYYIENKLHGFTGNALEWYRGASAYGHVEAAAAVKRLTASR